MFDRLRECCWFSLTAEVYFRRNNTLWGDLVMSSGHARVNYALLIDGKVKYVSIVDGKMISRAFADIAPDEKNLPLYKHYFDIQPIDRLPSESAVDELAYCMIDEQAAVDSNIPAGYTYLSQFFFHDITWLSEKGGVPKNKASSALDMDSVLGNQFANAEPACAGSTDLLRIGLTLDGYGKLGPLPEDVPRKPRCSVVSDDDPYPTGFPLIPDPRNEGFLQLAQTHLIFLKFYNAVARRNGFGGDFDEPATKREFIQHVQSVLLYDLLHKLIDLTIYEDIVVRNGRRVIHPNPIATDYPFLIPIEFAAGAARYGHSMVRASYDWNAEHGANNPAELLGLVTHSYQNSDPDHSPLLNLEPDWVIDWKRYFDFRNLVTGAPNPVKANAIGPRLVETMGSLPTYIRPTSPASKVPRTKTTFNLAKETLHRQLEFRMASAQTMIDAINATMPVALKIDKLTDDELAGSQSQPIGKAFGAFPELLEKTPIWFYVLREAEVRGNGNRLGPLGSRLVAETFHAAVEAAGADAITAHEDWAPTLPCHDAARFKMADLILFTQTN